MKIKKTLIIISLFFISFVYAQPLGNSNLPFENNDISVEKIMATMVVLGLYFIPTLVARDKIKWGYIFGLNLVTGWTIFGWFIALFWALKAKSKNRVEEEMDSKMNPENLEDLDD